MDGGEVASDNVVDEQYLHRRRHVSRCAWQVPYRPHYETGHAETDCSRATSEHTWWPSANRQGLASCIDRAASRLAIKGKPFENKNSETGYLSTLAVDGWICDRGAS